jgi:hypothetical protein
VTVTVTVTVNYTIVAVASMSHCIDGKLSQSLQRSSIGDDYLEGRGGFFVNLYVCVCTCMYVMCMHVCMYRLCMYVCISLNRVYVHAYAFLYIHTYM